MNRYQTRRSVARFHARPLVAFLLIASFGILFAGCGSGQTVIKGPSGADDFTFTEEDLARFQQLAGSGTVIGSGSDVLPEEGVGGELALGTGAVATTPTVIDLSMMKTYQGIRTLSSGSENTYQVTNTFLNLRKGPDAGAALIGRLNRGDLLTVIEFVNAGWAKVKLASGGEGYAAIQYIGKLTTSDRVAGEKKAFEGLYYVHFGFVNVREKPEQQSGKLGQIDGQAFVRPLQIDKDWARVSFQGKDGFVSMQYLAPFLPTFLVRQERFTLPILRYDVSQEGALQALGDQTAKLKQAGTHFLTLKGFRDLLLRQESGEASLPSKPVIVVISGLTKDNIRKASDALYASGIPATFILQTDQVGLSGITQKTLLTLVANGFDIQSGAHSGDDLRSLTNAQVKLEVEQSRKILEDMTGMPVFAIDYPVGGVNDRVTQVVSDAGYLFGLGNAPDKEFLRDQFLRLPSFSVSSNMTADDVLNIVR
ncbi:MAG: SH3 domain-containing protein [Candidatus Peribacteraceae bacterium]|jgi:peptidoglycan/xylan/chitin deacetylase (PgdA/CDA1 family)